VTGIKPDRITTDGPSAYPQAIRNIFGEQVTHRTKRYLNNRLEQDHWGIKRRYRPMWGFKSFDRAGRFCRLFDEGVHSYGPSHGAIKSSRSHSAGRSIGSDLPS
jgi:putative transposase